MRSVSAVVVSYFTGPLLARSIASLRADLNIRDIIVVDNGNWNGAVDAAVAVSDDLGDDPPVSVITGQGNVGFAAACNLGARRGAGEHLLFLNPDAAMPDGGVSQLLADAGECESPWVIGAKLVDRDGVEQQGSRRMTLTPWRAFVEATKLYALAPRHPYFRRFNLHGEPCPRAVARVPVISGACFFTPKADYFAIGGMDERYFLHVEDVDFCLRFANAGGNIYFTPNVAVLHQGSSSRVNPMRVEARKTASVLRYFRAHFADPYPAGFLPLVSACLWGAFAMKAAGRGLSRSLALIGFRARTGPAGMRRAREIAARRSAR